jgi:serine/threonine protein kinase
VPPIETASQSNANRLQNGALMIQADCPSRETLLRYLQGNFDSSQIDSLEEHVEQCPNCEETVAELEDTNDTLMRHLPLAATGDVEADADAPEWIERLKAGPPTKAVDPSDERMVGGQGESVANRWADGLTSYELLEILGKGGMGVVYRGRHRQLGRPVAVKVVRPKLVSAAEAHRRFDREIRILGGLNHPGIVMATDAGRVGSAAYLVMELIDGVDLARLVRSAGPLNVGEACEVARQIAVALSAAHVAGAVHRDVKPSNVMIDKTGRVKLLDFGLACLIELSSDHGETSLGRLIGTLDYMAPEQAEGIQVQSSADLYGLGATLFYLLAGRPPHASDRNYTLLRQLKALSCEDPPRLADLRLDVPEELSNLVATLLARNPADRPATAAGAADQLAAWANPDAKAELAKLLPTGDRSDDAEAAARSLVELIGSEPREVTGQPSAKEPAAANGGGRRIGRWLLGAAGFAAAVLGIVLLVKTPEGTLRIESEAKNVQVELVDEADCTTTVQIEEGENATQLRAGKYRIRLTGNHDNLMLTPGAVELRRGEERLARITQLPPNVSEKQNAGDGSIPDGSGMPATNEELTRVTIPVEYEDGRPATGAEVTMRMQGTGMQGEPERPVVVTGKADVKGVAFNRGLPYGKYEMTIKVADGGTASWSATLRDILLEFGGSYKQKVVAPAPEKRATVKVQTAFNSGGLKGLRFGNYVVGKGGAFGGGGIGVIWSPEPGKQELRFAHFPVLGNGITSTALSIMLSVTRDVKQPSGFHKSEFDFTAQPGGETLNWHWMRRDDYYSDELIMTEKSVIDPKNYGFQVVYDLKGSEYFSNPREEHGVQYLTFSDPGRTGNPLSLEFPPGKLECVVRAIYGQATAEITQALGLKPQAGREVWLEAKLNGESAWVPRAIDLSDWIHGKDILNPIAHKTLLLKPGETQTIRVASPNAPSVDGSGTKGAK